MDIPEIYIPQISIPNIHLSPTFSPKTDYIDINTIGCQHYHRDIKNTGNNNLLIDDPNGVTTSCPYPSYLPINYNPDNLTIIEEQPLMQNKTEMPKGENPKPNIPKEEDKKEDIVPDCPSSNDRRIGEYTSEARIERISGYKRGLDGIECIPLYEQVTFIDSVLPSPSSALNVTAISLIAAASPALLGIIKSVSKTIFKKIFKKKNNVKKK
tara:strand:- start:2303 stop:2935 length:633 start_codon:yes stop_codon:yes gene_type:complete